MKLAKPSVISIFNFDALQKRFTGRDGRQDQRHVLGKSRRDVFGRVRPLDLSERSVNRRK